QDGQDGGQNVVGFGQTSGPLVAAGQPAHSGFDDGHAPRSQQAQVLLDGRLLPHLGVHGRADHDGRPGGEEGGRQQVVGDAVGVAADDAGSGGRHQHEIGRLAQAGVRYGIGSVGRRGSRRDDVVGGGG